MFEEPTVSALSCVTKIGRCLGVFRTVFGKRVNLRKLTETLIGLLM